MTDSDHAKDSYLFNFLLTTIECTAHAGVAVVKKDARGVHIKQQIEHFDKPYFIDEQYLVCDDRVVVIVGWESIRAPARD